MASPEVKRKKSQEDLEDDDVSAAAGHRDQKVEPTFDAANLDSDGGTSSLIAATGAAASQNTSHVEDVTRMKPIKEKVADVDDVDMDTKTDTPNASNGNHAAQTDICRMDHKGDLTGEKAERNINVLEMKNESSVGSDSLNDDLNARNGEDKNDEEKTEKASMSGTKAATVIRQAYGYEFDDEGRLKDVKTGEGFQFDVHGDKAKNQKRYEALGELLTLHVYDLLETSVGLQRVTIPIDKREREPSGFVFASSDYQTNPNLLLLINGSGVVRAGQWARRLIINDCLDSGTQLPFIRAAQSRGWAILVLNTNQNEALVPTLNTSGNQDEEERDKEDRGKKRLSPIRGSRNPREHGCYVFENIVMERENLENIFVVAHSFGGVVTLDIAAEFSSFWRTKVKAVAFTDSVHGDQTVRRNQKLSSWFAENAINWVTSDKPVDVPMQSHSTIPRVSSGHTNHESTSWSAFDSIFKFLDEKKLQSEED